MFNEDRTFYASESMVDFKCLDPDLFVVISRAWLALDDLHIGLYRSVVIH